MLLQRPGAPAEDGSNRRPVGLHRGAAHSKKSAIKKTSSQDLRSRSSRTHGCHKRDKGRGERLKTALPDSTHNSSTRAAASRPGSVSVVNEVFEPPSMPAPSRQPTCCKAVPRGGGGSVGPPTPRSADGTRTSPWWKGAARTKPHPIKNSPTLWRPCRAVNTCVRHGCAVAAIIAHAGTWQLPGCWGLACVLVVLEAPLPADVRVATVVPGGGGGASAGPQGGQCASDSKDAESTSDDNTKRHLAIAGAETWCCGAEEDATQDPDIEVHKQCKRGKCGSAPETRATRTSEAKSAPRHGMVNVE